MSIVQRNHRSSRAVTKDVTSGDATGSDAARCDVARRDTTTVASSKAGHQTKDMQKIKGMTVEITQPSEPDAYGGWWISVYDENALTNARANGEDLLSITQPRIPKKQQVAAQPLVVTAATAPSTDSSWSADDISNSRPDLLDSSNQGGTVYVRGYYRKNGTYVHSYTRRR